MARRAPAPRFRAAALWLALAAITFAAGFAVYHLYSTLRRELAGQSEKACAQAKANFEQLIESTTAGAKREALEQLIRFHVDGLGVSLQQWDKAHPEIVGTFIWNSDEPLSSGVDLNLTPAQLAVGWKGLRETQKVASQLSRFSAEHADAAARGAAFPVEKNAFFAESSFGYHEENAELARSDGKTVDAWAGWIERLDRFHAPWILWYQLGPDLPVRGCLLDAQPIMRQLHDQLPDPALGQLKLARGYGPPSHSGFVVTAEPGTLFASKQSAAAIAALAVALLLALVLLAAFTLARFTRRASLEAERKTTFVAQVSHELRTPLTSIQMFADMLGAHALPEEKREKYLGHITRETARLRHLVERLLTFSALEQNKFKASLETVELGALVHEVLDETAALLSAAGLAPDIRLPAEKIEVRSDRAALKQALLNLLENAAKYAPQNGPLTVALETTAREIRLRVSDAGPGVPAAIRDTLFEPFVQGEETLTGKKPGLGLGLSIARGQLRAGGADLVLLPTDRGATFELRIPR